MPKFKLGDVLEKIIDNRGRNPDYYSSEGYYVLDNYLINGSKYPNEKLVKRYVDQNIHTNFLRKYLEKNDVCITLVGNGIGNLCMIPSDKWVTIQNSIGLHGKSNLLDNTFLYYYLRLHKKSIVALDRGSSQPSILQGDLLSLQIDIPELPVQKSAARVLSILDDKIALNSRINTELESTARALYNYWFVQFEFPDESGRPYKTAGGAMVYNEELKREIPANWTVKKLKDLFEFDKGTEVGSSAYSEVQKKGFVRFYRVGDIDGNSTTFVGNESTLNIAKPSDVVVTFDGSVGKLGLGLDGAISGGLRKIYDKSGEIDNSFVWLLFLDSHTKTTIEKYATGSVLLHAGSSINHLNMPFNKEVVLRFQEVVKPIFEQYISNKQEVVSLAQLRDYLLPMLMNGQVVVKD